LFFEHVDEEDIGANQCEASHHPFVILTGRRGTSSPSRWDS
jgi:hypothetical protein